MTKTELKKISDKLFRISEYINENYNLDTYINKDTLSIWVNVWNKNLSESYDIEMSKEQIKEFNKELNNTKK
tara:strand:+ start:187 stop:402 length:216 start_codon:yes stop_codon:yes gene_type:complete